MATRPNVYQPAAGPQWLPDYTRSIEREIQRAVAPYPSRAKLRFVGG